MCGVFERKNVTSLKIKSNKLIFEYDTAIKKYLELEKS